MRSVTSARKPAAIPKLGHYERKLSSSSFLFDRPERAISGDERFLAEE
jgi:hypothetical protein